MKSIIELAREANKYASHQTDDRYDWQIIRDERFANIVRAAALEEAAGVCCEHEELRDHTPLDCAIAIRALKEKT